MPSDPIAIAQTPPHAAHAPPPPAISSTPSSAVSASPQTPFFQSNLFRWPLAPPYRSPPGGPAALPDTPTAAKAAPASAPASAPAKPAMPPAFCDDDHDEHHDALAVGDLADMQSRSYHASVRRAASISVQPATGVFAALAESGAAGPMGERVGRGQGVLRRLSLGGGFARPFIAPPGHPSPPQASAASVPPPAAAASVPPPAPAPAPAPAVTVATTDDLPPALGPKSARRRFSESGGRRRGVSPMGERILRDHGHF